MNVLVIPRRICERMTLVREAPYRALHGFSESVRRKFVLPVFCIQVLLDLTDKELTFTAYCRVREIVIHDPDTDVFRHILQGEGLQLLYANGIVVFLPKFFPCVWCRCGLVL